MRSLGWDAYTIYAPRSLLAIVLLCRDRHLLESLMLMREVRIAQLHLAAATRTEAWTCYFVGRAEFAGRDGEIGLICDIAMEWRGRIWKVLLLLVVMCRRCVGRRDFKGGRCLSLRKLSCLIVDGKVAVTRRQKLGH